MSRGSRPAQALMSAPTQKALSPAAVRMTQRIATSASILVATSASVSIISGVSACSFSARSSMTVAIAPSMWSFTRLVDDSGMGARLEFSIQRGVAEQRGVHWFEVRIDFQRKCCLIEHVALEVNARRNLPHDQPIRNQVEDAALGDVADVLSAPARHPAAESNML